MLILHHLEPYHWAVAGLSIGGITLLLLWVTNQRLGISTGFENLCGLVIKAPYFRRSEIAGSHGWRLPFLGGLVLGGFLSAALSGGWAPFWSLGMFDTVIGWGPSGKLVWMFGGGLLIGFGTRMAGGCTSGHGIFGISNLERASLESTVSFMAAGIVTSSLVHRLGGL
ncbi:MAG: YeeE/YedE thiosulfate transporter family protein [Myxococcota bacterium]